VDPALLLCWSACGAAVADEKPPPPPSPAQIKSCVEQMDVGGKWRFEWKVLEIDLLQLETVGDDSGKILGELGLKCDLLTLGLVSGDRHHFADDIV
jgi:hypothetical protein